MAAWLRVERHIELDVDLSVFGGSSLTTNIPVPKDRPLDTGDVPSTYVPARNTVFLALALAWAETLDAADIFIGVNALDYPGIRTAGLSSSRRSNNLHHSPRLAGLRGGAFRVHAPLMTLTKADIVRKARSLVSTTD